MDKIHEKYTGKKSVDYCGGAYLCIEISQALYKNGFDDAYALYLDVDTIVLNDFQLNPPITAKNSFNFRI